MDLPSTIFAETRNDVGRITSAEHTIRLIEGTPSIHFRRYRQSPAVNEQIRKEIVGLLNAGLIRPSISPWASPVSLKKKKDGSNRMVIDYRRLNNVTIDEYFPLHYIDDLLNRVANAEIYTTLDLAWGYHQVALSTDSIEKSSFVTSNGQYEYLVLPFGLKNAPSTFQRVLRDILRPFIKRGVEDYLYDIVIYSNDFYEHRQTLEDVINALSQQNIRLRREKCVFFQSKIEVLGHVVMHNSIQPSSAKIKAVMSFPVPTTLRQVQQFAGLANYYRSFVQNYSEIASPLYQLTKKDAIFEWNEKCQTAFDTLKERITSQPILRAFNLKLECKLQTDASALGIWSNPFAKGRKERRIRN